MGRVSDAKQKLLAVAFDLIHENSYGAVSVEDICSRAKVNKGSFYYFFKSKTDLVVAAYEERWRLNEPEYARSFAKTNPPLKRLTLWCDYIRATQRQREKRYKHVNGCPYSSVGGELATQDKKIAVSTQKLIERNVSHLVEAIHDAQQAGEAIVDNAQAAGERVHAFTIGLLLRAKIYNDLKVLRQLDAGVLALAGALPYRPRAGRRKGTATGGNK